MNLRAFAGPMGKKQCSSTEIVQPMGYKQKQVVIFVWEVAAVNQADIEGELRRKKYQFMVSEYLDLNVKLGEPIDFLFVYTNLS